MLTKISQFRFAALIVALCCLVACDSSSRHQGDLSFFIPENSLIILRTSSLQDLASDFKNNSLLSKSSLSLWENQLKTDLGYLGKLQLEGPSYICLSVREDTIFDYTIIAKQHANLIKRDSLDTIAVQDYTRLQKRIGSLNADVNAGFATIIDSVFVFSTNKSILTKALDQKQSFYPNALNKLLAALPDTAPAIFINNQDSSGIINKYFNRSLSKNAPFEAWTGLSFKVLPGELSFNGVTMPADSTQTSLTAFNNTLPQKLNYDKIVPIDAKGVIALSYDSYELFYNQLTTADQVTDSLEITQAFMSSTVGTTIIYNSSGYSLAFEPVDLSISLDLLTPALENQENFKGVTLFKLTQNLPIKAMVAPYADSVQTKANYIFVLADQILSCTTKEQAQELISQFLTNNTLANNDLYKETKAALQETASITMIAMQPAFKKKLVSWKLPSNSELLDNLNFNKYPLGIVQFENQGSFTHINGLFKESGTQPQGIGVQELFTLQHNSPFIIGPQFFTNHRSGRKDIVFQDVNNKLHLYASNGTKLWEKQLDGPILGDINEVDLLRNRKIQMAFNTAKTLYILDRNGREVAPFPIVFKDKVTQPLAVFDYDNNRKYRFVVTQDDQILMYDSQAKIVKGFTFTKAQSNLAFAPQHFRIGNKDYIVIAETSGKLYIKSRVGNDRVKVNKTFKFGTLAPLAEDGSFVVITSDNTKETISTTGKVSSKNLGISNDFALNIKGKTKVSLDDNLLRINGRLIELPFGIYTAPQIFTVLRITYIALTDTQSKKLYVYTTTGELLPNFPIFGTAAAVLGDATNNRSLNILVASDDNGIILYEIR